MNVTNINCNTLCCRWESINPDGDGVRNVWTSSCAFCKCYSEIYLINYYHKLFNFIFCNNHSRSLYWLMLSTNKNIPFYIFTHQRMSFSVEVNEFFISNFVSTAKCKPKSWSNEWVIHNYSGNFHILEDYSSLLNGFL